MPQTDTKDDLTLKLPDAAATMALGRALAPLLLPACVIWLEGDLGAGKTTLVRALLRARGHEGAVKSPTYSLVEVYVVSNIYWYHFDFYRFNEPEEFEDAGLGEYFRDDAICLVEWPAKAMPYVPAADLSLVFRFASAGDRPDDPGLRKSTEDARIVELRARTEAGRQCLKTLASFCAGAS